MVVIVVAVTRMASGLTAGRTNPGAAEFEELRREVRELKAEVRKLGERG